MVRPLRIQYEGAYYHIMNRGLERKNIFLNNRHRNFFLDLLAEISERFLIEIHSYCLMDNHYHLLLSTTLPNLNLAMKHLNGVYTLRFNRDVKRDGPLFRGRYKSVLVDKENYLLNVSRYIHKNPSSAKIIKDDQKYSWSSYRYYNLNNSKKPKWLTTGEVLNYFDGNCKQYAKFVEERIDENTKKFYSSKNLKSILGNKLFVKELSDNFFKKNPSSDISNRKQIISAKYPTLDESLLRVAEKYKINPNIILKNDSRNYIFERSLLIYIFMFNPRYNLVEKGKFLGISDDGVSQNYKRFLNKLKLDKKRANEVESVRKDIYG